MALRYSAHVVSQVRTATTEPAAAAAFPLLTQHNGTESERENRTATQGILSIVYLRKATEKV